MNAEEAWNLYRERGVIVPGYQGEIAERKQLTNEWVEAGVDMI